MSEDDYCRTIEAHLCRRNGGHLIRIVGPSFELVSGWAERGVPLSVACRGIDRYFDRQAGKGPRRRPIRIDFCDADVLDMFDQWRRLVRVPGVEGAAESGEDPADRGRRGTLAQHLERTWSRLSAAAVEDNAALAAEVATLLVVMADMRQGGGSVRGHAREATLAKLESLDAELVAAARAGANHAVLREVRSEAESELASYRQRMSPDDFDRARSKCEDRLLRDRWRLPTLSFDAP